MMLESKMGFLFRIGNISTMVRDYIIQKKQEVKTEETVSE